MADYWSGAATVPMYSPRARSRITSHTILRLRSPMPPRQELSAGESNLPGTSPCSRTPFFQVLFQLGLRCPPLVKPGEAVMTQVLMSLTDV